MPGGKEAGVNRFFGQDFERGISRIEEGGLTASGSCSVIFRFCFLFQDCNSHLLPGRLTF